MGWEPAHWLWGRVLVLCIVLATLGGLIFYGSSGELQASVIGGLVLFAFDLVVVGGLVIWRLHR